MPLGEFIGSALGEIFSFVIRLILEVVFCHVLYWTGFLVLAIAALGNMNFKFPIRSWAEAIQTTTRSGM